MSRIDGRSNDEIRKIEIIRNYTEHPEGCVLIKCGRTWVLCTASVEEGKPPFLADKAQGWVDAEYSMLPRATHTRGGRSRNARALEISRLIGRSLRAIVKMEKIDGYTITIDCDVLQADGGTRTTSITGAYVALHDAVQHMLKKGMIKENPLKCMVAATSVGIDEKGQLLLDLKYEEDCVAETDLNVIMTDQGNFVEIQGTAEGDPFTPEQFQSMIKIASKGIQDLIENQKKVLA